MLVKPLRTGAKFAAFVVGLSFINALTRAYFGWSNGYIPGTGAHNWIDFWAIQIVMMIVFGLLAFVFGLVFRFFRNRFSKQPELQQ